MLIRAISDLLLVYAYTRMPVGARDLASPVSIERPIGGTAGSLGRRRRMLSADSRIRWGSGMERAIISWWNGRAPGLRPGGASARTSQLLWHRRRRSGRASPCAPPAIARDSRDWTR